MKPLNTYQTKRLPIKLDPKTRTKQSFKQEADINNIVNKYKKTGTVTWFAKNEPRFAEFPENFDYKTALDTIHAAEELFASVPSYIRDRFDNDAESFITFCQNPENREEMEELGLREPRTPREVQAVADDKEKAPQAPSEPAQPAQPN